MVEEATPTQIPHKIAVNTKWTLAYLVLGIPLIILELFGVFRPDKGDTISENVWWLQGKFWPIRLVMALFTLWLFVHFLFG